MLKPIHGEILDITDIGDVAYVVHLGESHYEVRWLTWSNGRWDYEAMNVPTAAEALTILSKWREVQG